MVVVALVAVWIAVACGLALVLGRSLAVAEKSDRWRHGHREVRDLRKQTHLHLAPVVVDEASRAA